MNNMTMSLAVKLGSLAVHIDEYLFSGGGHDVDKSAIRTLLDDPEVRNHLDILQSYSLLPVRRDGATYSAVVVP